MKVRSLCCCLLAVAVGAGLSLSVAGAAHADEVLPLEQPYVGTLPEHGIERGGWTRVYADKPCDFEKTAESIGHGVNLAFPIGLTVSRSGEIRDVQWDGPAFKAGLVPGLTLVAVNGKDDSPDALNEAVTAAKTGNAPIELRLKNVDVYSTAKVDHHAGLKYPQLLRVDGKDLPGAIAAARQ